MDIRPPDGKLSGTGLLADDIWLAGHSDTTGKPLMQSRVLGLGLAAGLLADLLLKDAIAITAARTVVTGPAAWEGDPLTGTVQGKVAAEKPLPVTGWLDYLAAGLHDPVAARLEIAGYLTREPRRLLRPPRWVPVNPDWAYSPLIRIRAALNPRQMPSRYGITLAAIAFACGLKWRLDEYQITGRSAAEILPMFPLAYRELITCTQVAADNAAAVQLRM